MKKPSAEKIRAARPLSAFAAQIVDPLSRCNVCGTLVDPSDLPMTVWREHDERDRPIAGNDALIFLGSSKAHASCQRALEEHPRLYAEEAGNPGHFPALCVDCKFRDGLSCTHDRLRVNGGPGLLVTLDGLRGIVCTRGKGCHVPIKRAVKCEGRSSP